MCTKECALCSIVRYGLRLCIGAMRCSPANASLFTAIGASGGWTAAAIVAADGLRDGNRGAESFRSGTGEGLEAGMMENSNN